MNSLKLYQFFIDTMVKVSKGCITANRIKKKHYYPNNSEKHVKFGDFMTKLSEDDALYIAELLEEERCNAVHDVLVRLNEFVDLNDLKLIFGDVEMAKEPYETEMYYDFICRYKNNEWSKIE